MLQNPNDISNIKLIDFGLSKDCQQNSAIKSLCSGSPYYIAPEVIRNELSMACDMWSLGVVMYICLIGKLPFPGNSTEEVFMNV
jgi:serine/threonine protein kinase